ncbi:MAG TPA: hypothetical protein PLB81_00300 [Deltaproteobacteria bacterium]|mgnify:CR=1 FL=1|nr:hypothetical protein [Deltaproteobacteria bacterium]
MGKDRKTDVMVLLCVCIACLLTVSACSKKTSEEKAAEAVAEKILEHGSGQDMDVDIQGENIKIEGEGYKAEITRSTSWPADMFADVPRFTAGTVENVLKDNVGGTQKFTIYLKDFDGEAVRRYEETLKAKGWKSTFMQMGEGGMLNAQKGQLGMNFAFNTQGRDGTLMVYTAKE